MKSISFIWDFHLVDSWGFVTKVCLTLSILLVQLQFGDTAKNFECPQQFGYYADNSDCNKYFVCVFGDALLEKCTPGLYFNNELRMCDWPRNVKGCDSEERSGDSKYGSSSSEEKRKFGTSTPRPRSSSNIRSSHRSQSQKDNIPNPNSIAPPNPTQNSRYQSRYTPPISGEQYIAAAKNTTYVHFRPLSSMYTKSATTSTTTTTTPISKPRAQIVSSPASYKPAYYRVTSKPSVQQNSQGIRTSTISNKRKDYEDEGEYYDDEEYEDDEDEPEILMNVNPRNRNNAYVSPINPSTQRTPAPYNRNSHARAVSTNTISNRPSANSYNSRTRNSNAGSNSLSSTSTSSSRNTNTRPVYISFHYRNRNPSSGQNSVNSASRSTSTERTTNHQNRNSYSNNRQPENTSTSKENTRSSSYNAYNSNNHRNQIDANKNSALSSVYTTRPRESDAQIRLRPQTNRVPSQQSLDNGGDSLDAQFGTNPRSISLPDAPYRLNSFVSINEAKKAERNQLSKPQVTSTRYLAPAKPPPQTGPSSAFDDYPDYYYDYDDEDYEDDESDDDSIAKPVPKVVIRIQKPSSTPKTTRATTTRRPTPTTRRPPTTRPAKRPLPFGISRPATKSPPRFGPKQLPQLPSRPPPLYTTPKPLNTAEKCTPQKCVLPDCRCGGADIPGSLPPHQVPQIVLITFDDAVNDLNYELYSEIFDNRVNPNGCPILGTFYVSHEWTDYGMVQTLYSKGHEMASHSITHSHGEKFSVSHWTKEINGQREILHLYGGVKLEDIRGMRAPFLQVGGNHMFEMLYESNFTYDSSMPVLDNKPPFYPYTLDYALGHECMIPPCPTKSFPGLWEVGMVMWNDYRGGRCSMGDACANPDNAEDVYKMLMKNFNRHYNSNRAPFGLFYHAAWFTTQHFRRGYIKFIEEINAKNDVYMITNWQAIQWMREPTPLSHIKSFKPWQCPKDPEKPGPCRHPTTCNISYKGGNRNMRTCQPCPSNYPWTGRTGFDEVYG